MGSKFVEGRSVEFSKSYEESSPSTPIFFILSPGVDPLKDVEALGECHRRREGKPSGVTPATRRMVIPCQKHGERPRWNVRRCGCCARQCGGPSGRRTQNYT